MPAWMTCYQWIITTWYLRYQHPLPTLLWGFYQIPLDAMAPARIVYWNKFGRPEREDLAVYLPPFPDGWWYDDTKAARIEISQ